MFDKCQQKSVIISVSFESVWLFAPGMFHRISKNYWWSLCRMPDIISIMLSI